MTREDAIETIATTTIHLGHEGPPPLYEVAKLQSCLEYAYTHGDWPDAAQLRTFLQSYRWPHCFFDAERNRRMYVTR